MQDLKSDGRLLVTHFFTSVVAASRMKSSSDCSVVKSLLRFIPRAIDEYSSLLCKFAGSAEITGAFWLAEMENCGASVFAIGTPDD